MTNFNKVLRQYLLLPTLALFLCLFLGINAKAATGGKVYVTVEKFTLGQGYLVEPTEVEIAEGEKASSVLEKVLKANGYQYSLYDEVWYLAGIKNGFSICRKPENKAKKIRFCWKRLGTYLVIEWELFLNVFRRFLDRA